MNSQTFNGEMHGNQFRSDDFINQTGTWLNSNEEILNPKAGVQYNDLRGTSVADKYDGGRLQEFVNEHDLIEDSQSFLGIRFTVSEVHDKVPDASIAVYCLNKDVQLGEAERIQAKIIDMKVMDFFQLFNRFAVSFGEAGGMEEPGLCGTSAADKHDRGRFSKFLEEHDLDKNSQRFLGMRFTVSAVHGAVPVASIVVCYWNKDMRLTEAKEIEVKVMEFFELFKRFEVLLWSDEADGLQAGMKERDIVVEYEYV